MNLKHLNLFNRILNASSVVQSVILFKSEMMINVNVSVESIARVNKIIVGILAHVFVRIIGIKKVLLLIQ